MNAHVPVESGWFDKIRNSVNIESVSKKLNLSKHKLLDMALFGGIGFLVGFLWKRYANYFMALILFMAGLFILQQFEVIMIKVNWMKIQECCGIQPAVITDVDILPTMLWNWIRANVLILLSFFIGFGLGLKVG